MELSVVLDDVVVDRRTVDYYRAQGDISFYWPDVPGTFTLRMYDATAGRLHLLVTDIPGNRLDEGTVRFPYETPVPPPGSGVHQYVVELVQGNVRVPLSRTIREPLDGEVRAQTYFLVRAPRSTRP